MRQTVQGSQAQVDRHAALTVAFSADSTTPTFQVASASGIGAQGRMAWQDAAFPSPASATPVNGAGVGVGSRGALLIGVG